MINQDLTEIPEVKYVIKKDTKHGLEVYLARIQNAETGEILQEREYLSYQFAWMFINRVQTNLARAWTGTKDSGKIKAAALLALTGK